MSKAEWGGKHRCTNCDARFYDMQRKPIRCPKCDTVFVVAAASGTPARGPRSRAKRPYVPASFGTAAAEPDRREWRPDQRAADEAEETEPDLADDNDESEIDADEPDIAEDTDEGEGDEKVKC